MDFGLNDTEQATCELAEKMLRDFSSQERLLMIEESGNRLDAELWASLRESGLTAIGVAAEHGGSDLGFSETCLLLEQLGKTVAAVPLLGHLVALQTLQQAGVSELLVQYLQGEGWLAASSRTDSNTLRVTEGGITGSIAAVPYAPGAMALLLPVREEDDTFHLYLVAGKQPGVAILAQTGTDKSPMGEVTLEGVAGQYLGNNALLEWMRQRLIAAGCAVQSGVVEEAVAMTASYVAEREAFGARIGTFQAVSQRMADVYIDAMILQVTSRNAASVLARCDDAAADVLTAKITACDTGHRVLAACQHLHGGIGHDRSYPLWRYAVAAKQNELACTSGSEAAAELGVLLATEPRLAQL